MPVQALESALRDELAMALELNNMGGFIWDLSSDHVFLDRGALAVFDLDPTDFDGQVVRLHERVLPEDLPGWGRRRAEALAARSTSYGGYFRIRRSDGEIRWAHTQAAIKRDDAGTPQRIIGIIREAGPELQHAEQQAALESNRKRQTDIVQAFTTALSQALTVDDVLAALASDAFLGPLDAVGVSLGIMEQDRLRHLAGATPDVLQGMRFTRLDDPMPGSDVLRTREPLFLSRDAVRDRYPMVWPYVENTELTAGVVLPLAAQARPTGVLVIYYEGKTDFSPEERNLLLGLAATVAQSVQRALLYDEEHAMAVGLQQSMLPASIPAVAGLRVAVRYQPARTGHQIGGDWYDVIPLPGGRAGLVVGDVQGHDIHAAAVMGQLRTGLRAYAAEGHPPAALMDKASVFLDDLDTERLATCIYADLDPATGHARIVRAGHPGPLIRHADRRTTSPSVAGGLPLGLPQYSDTPYPTTHLQLGPEDTLLLCTDGLLEFHGTDLNAGERQIRALLRDGPADLDQLAEHIVATIGTRQGQEDDVALLLASRQPLTTSPAPSPPGRLTAVTLTTSSIAEETVPSSGGDLVEDGQRQKAGGDTQR
jgi:GAF domain-containing protein